MHVKIKQYIQRIKDNDPTLTEINLADLRLRDEDIAPLMEELAANPTAAQGIITLDLSSNQLSTMIYPFILSSLTELNLLNNMIKTFDPSLFILLNQNLNGQIGVEGNPLTRITVAKMTRLEIFYGPVFAEQITPAALGEHFQALLENKNILDKKSQNVLNMLARAPVKLPDELVSMVFEFLGPFESEINSLKVLFADQQDVIVAFANSAEFKAMSADYYTRFEIGKFGFEAGVDAMAMKTLLSYYQQFNRYTTNFNSLRGDQTRLDPMQNPFQIIKRPDM